MQDKISSTTNSNESVSPPSSPTTTYVNSFLASFGQVKSTIESILPNATSVDFLQNGIITSNLSLLERQLSEAYMFLPTYTCKVSQDSLDSLRKIINKKRQATIGRQKFTFGLARKSTSSISSSSNNGCFNLPTVTTTRTGCSGSLTSSCTISSGDEESGSASDSSNCNSYSSSLPSLEYFKSIKAGTRNIIGENINISRNDIHGIDYELESLENCTICLPGSPSTLYLTELTGCIINCGPIPSSIYIDKCSKCTLTLATQQLRIYGSNECTFFVDVKSKPIIEDCTQLSFGKYNYEYDQMKSDFDSCQFQSENCYNQVVDFNWLSNYPSPNWSVIETI